MQKRAEMKEIEMVVLCSCGRPWMSAIMPSIIV